jgi:translation initiation factor IF-3
MRMAEDVGLDLVEVAPEARPPVCRILDYGKYKYEQKKKARATKKGSTKLKGMRLRPKTDDGDLATKTKRAREFLTEGDKVMFTVIFRGRELARQDLGLDLLKRVATMLEDVAKIEKTPAMEGRRMHMTLVRK